MTDKQPEALRIAEELLALFGPTEIDERAATELRRLHEENEALRAELAPIKKAVIKKRREKAWEKRDLNKCICDHCEFCVHCYPLEFREGGYWDQEEAKAEEK